MGQHAFKKTDVKQAQVQSILFAALLAAPKTVTNLIPSSIIQRLFGSDNMNLHRGKASGGEGGLSTWLSQRWRGEGGWWMACICALACQKDSLGFWFFFFYSIFYILLKVKLPVCDCHMVFCVFNKSEFSSSWTYTSTIMICGTWTSGSH